MLRNLIRCPVSAGIGRRLALFIRGREGVSLMEFALILPIFLVLVFGGMEFGRYILLNQQLSRVAVSTGDLVSQAKKVTEDDIAQIFVAAEISVAPFELGVNGAIVVSSIGTEDAPVEPKVLWQHVGAGTAVVKSSVGGVGLPANLPQGFEMRKDQNVIVAEVFYDYEPFFFGGILPTQKVYHFALHRPRLKPLLAVEPSP